MIKYSLTSIAFTFSCVICSAYSHAETTSPTPQPSIVIEKETKRPQLTDTQAATIATLSAHLDYAGHIESLQHDPWDPSTNGIGEVESFVSKYIVAADGTGTHTTIQAAIETTKKVGGAERVYILIKAGEYREQVCIKDAPPITLYGLDKDASQVIIVNNKANSTAKDPNLLLNNCDNRLGKDSYGTSGSSTFFAYSNHFQAKNITIANDFDEKELKNGIQAVALSSTGDKLQFENVRFLGHQDTLQVKSPDVGTIARSYFRNVYIEGDVDYVFGRGVAVFENSEFKSLKPEDSSYSFVFAPSHSQRFPVGYLVLNSKFTSNNDKLLKGRFNLARAWDDNNGTYYAKDGQIYLPNGQVIIRDSVIGKHINPKQPWAAAATTERPYSSSTPVTISYRQVETTFPPNRFFEYKNITK